MSALNSLVRIHGWALTEKREKLAGLERLADKLRDDLAQLERELAREQGAATGSLEGTLAFPTFLAATLERRKRLRTSIRNLELAVDAAREEVQRAFEEVKRFEQARDADAARQAAQAARREQAALDEIGANVHRRGRRPEAG